MNFAWVGIWQVEARIHENGWTAEFVIPFSTLSSSKEQFQVWGINFFRLIRRRNESTWWSPVPRRYGYFQISRAGELRALQRQAQKRGGQTEREAPEKPLRVRLSSLAGINEFRSQGAGDGGGVRWERGS